MLLIADPGSTHMGKKQYVHEITKQAAEAGFDVIKWQLFPNTDEYKHNEHMSFDLFDYACERAVKYKIDCTASVFGGKEAEKLAACRRIPFVKFGFSQRHELDRINGFVRLGRKVIVTTSVMDRHLLPKEAKKLFVYEVNNKPVYPVTCDINFEMLFDHMFDGFSDHTLGIHQARRAVEAGARIIEKHISLDYSDITCPDAAFALRPKLFDIFVKGLK